MNKAKELTKAQELAYELKIGEVMKKDVVIVKPDSLMSDLRGILRDNRISGVPVVDGNRLVGLISLEDFIKSLANGEVDKPVKEKMARKLVIIYKDEPLVHAIEKFKRYGFGRLPVID